MARARNIKPGFFMNEQMAELHPLTRLVFIGLWTIADFRGCVEWRPKRIKIQVLPYDDHDLEAAANDLQKAGFLTRYEVAGQSYVKISNFERHQNPHKNERESGSDIPDLPEPQITENREDTEKPEKIGTKTELVQSETEPLVPLTDSLNPLTDSGFLSADTPPPAPRFGEPSKFEHPAVVLFEEAFIFKVGSNFAKAVSEKVSDMGVWSGLLQNKRAFADKSLDDRRKVCNWILDEYDKRVLSKQNGQPIKNFREQRSEEKIADRNIVDAARRRIAEADANLSGSNAGDSQRQLRIVGTKPDDGRKSLTG